MDDFESSKNYNLTSNFVANLYIKLTHDNFTIFYFFTEIPVELF
jgi:hypothetical protein